MAEPRSLQQRQTDTRNRLESDTDLWVASASPEGAPYLIPLSFDWDGDRIVLATLPESTTGKNLTGTGQVRLGLGHTRDVTVIEGTVNELELDELDSASALKFTQRTGFDPREQPERYCWYVVTPVRMQAWREANELRGRSIMRDGIWLS